MSGTSKPGLFQTMLFIVLAVGAYITIFLNIEPLNQFFLSKAVIPAICLLGTVIVIAFLYGTAVSHVLSFLGLESDH